MSHRQTDTERHEAPSPWQQWIKLWITLSFVELFSGFRFMRVWLIVIWQSMRVWGEDNHLHEIQNRRSCAELVPNEDCSHLVFAVKKKSSWLLEFSLLMPFFCFKCFFQWDPQCIWTQKQGTLLNNITNRQIYLMTLNTIFKLSDGPQICYLRTSTNAIDL